MRVHLLSDGSRQLDMGSLEPDKPYDDCIEQCIELGLIEKMQHGEHDYARITQAGINVFCVLLEMTANMTDPENKLKMT